MRHPRLPSRSRRISATVLAVSVALSLAACAGPELAPPVDEKATGQDAEARLEEGRRHGGAHTQGNSTGGNSTGANPAATNQGTPDPGSASGASFQQALTQLEDSFSGELVGKLEGLRGRVAVFPVWLRTPATNRWGSCGVGDRIAADVAASLSQGGRSVLQGAGLKQALLAANCGLRTLTGPEVARGMARRLTGTAFVQVITEGSIQVQNSGGFGGNRIVSVQLEARDVQTDRVLVRRDMQTADPAAVAQAERLLQQPGAWRIGELAESFTPSVDREFDVLATAALTRLFDQTPELFLERRILVQPLEMGSTPALERQLVAQQRALVAALDAAERKAEAAGATDPFTAALDGPVTVEGKDYATGNDAVLAYQRRRAEAYGTGAGTLAGDLARSLGETIRSMTGGRSTLVAADDRRQAIALVQSDALEFQLHDSLRSSSIGTVQSDAADVVVRTSLRQRIENFVLSVTVHDLADPNRGRTETITLPDWMVPALRKAASRR